MSIVFKIKSENVKSWRWTVKSPRIPDPDNVKLYFQQYVLINENIKKVKNHSAIFKKRP